MPKKDPYKTLRVPKNATKAKIKRAYRQRAKETHPDRTRDDGAEFREVHRAYKLLTDDRARDRFDRTGETDDDAAAKSERNTPIDDILKVLFRQITTDLYNADKDPATEDLVAHMETLLRKTTMLLHGQMRDPTQRETFWRRIIGRFETDAPDNLFEVLAQQQLAEAQAQMRSIENQIAANGEALKVLRRFSFKRDSTERQNFAGTPFLFEALDETTIGRDRPWRRAW